MTRLSDDIKQEIQDAYRAWLAARSFRPRRGQREMIAAIARALTRDAERRLVIEAGTGTGKTAAYCLAAIPIGRRLGKTVVISSATVALQEQVVYRDLPDLQETSGLNFTFALAKGRGRYLCLKRLDDQLKYQGASDAPLFHELGGVDEARSASYQALLGAFSERRWDGEQDSWPDALDADLWRSVTTDHRGCTNNRCSYFKQCPFFRARNRLDGVDVIVANHDLVLADLSLGGGAVLPEPEDVIYLFDEAHHLPEKTQQHFSNAARIGSAAAWIATVTATLGTMTQRFARPEVLVDLATRAADHGAQVEVELRLLAEVAGALEFSPRDDGAAIHRFPFGQVPAALSGAAAAALVPFRDLSNDIDSAYDRTQQAFQGEISWERGFEAEDWLPVLGQLKTRALAIEALLDDFARPVEPGARARWAYRHDEDIELVSTPIVPGSLLADALWSRAYAAVCTSATLTAVGSFQRFLDRSGLAGAETLRIPSPFDFPRIATLSVPRMRSEPGDFAAHSDEVAELLPGLLGGEPSALVLFTSWRQMFAVLDRLDQEFRARLKVQGEAAKQALLDAHRQDVDAGRPSVLFGLASFAEGVDLPDDYCRHVVIVKLPFAVPDDPLDQAMAEWAEHQGRNPFYDISVPDAAQRLVQACGRLIRHEKDWGTITLLDRRIVTRRYGQDLLRSLPPYRLDVA